MSMRPPSQVFFLNVDLESAWSAHHLLAYMCWPRDADRRLRLVAIFADLADLLDNLFGEFLFQVRLTIARYGVPPPKEALQSIIDDCATDAAHKDVLMTFVEDQALPPVLDGRNVGLEARFWGSVITSPGRFRAPGERIWTSLIKPNGGWRAMADAPAFDEIREEISGRMRGHAMLSGLSLYMVASISEHHKALTLSFNLTYRIIAAMLDCLPVRSEDWLKKNLPRWHCIAPMWCGLLTEADCWSDETLLDIDKLELAAFDVLDSNERRARLLSYAAWFSGFIVGENRPKNIRRRRDQIVQFPPSIQPKKPQLRPLSRRVLAVAKRYR
jgi:hypothetical protein